MRRKIFGAMLTVVIASLVPAGAATARPFSAHELEPLSVSGASKAAIVSRRGRMARVVVRLAGPSVGQVQGAAGVQGRTLSALGVKSRRAMVFRNQVPVIRLVRRSGGTVRYRYSDAYNGLAITIPRSKLFRLMRHPDVVSVRPTHLVYRLNGVSNSFTGATQAWSDYGLHGEGIRVAIIDDGVDYTHADFGGAGTPEAFLANDPKKLERGSFPTAKVVAGYDFVGDLYDAASTDPNALAPRPDSDPLGCGGHGTHVAGTAAGQGVTATGATYAGPYDTASVGAAGLAVAPGSAPAASVLAYKVFGCEGSVTNDIVAAAVERAVRDHAQVINLSLGSDFGHADDVDAVAIDNAVRAGVVVVASAGNAGSRAYMVGSPSVANGALSVAALDANERFAGVTISDGTATVTALNANGSQALPLTAPLALTSDGAGGLSLGCAAADFGDVTGKIAVVARGTCARVDKALFGQQAGAVAVVMVNNDAGLPPFEGDIAGVTIPFLGVEQGDGATLAAMNPASVTLDITEITNPGFRLAVGFSSAGPRSGDSAVKPDVIAPGVSLLSAAVGTGSGGIRESGTSMSSPHTAGIAALVRQAHPTWPASAIKAAIVNTADATKLLVDDQRVNGTGVANPVGAIATDSVVTAGGLAASLSFGHAQVTGGFDKARSVTVRNNGTVPHTYALTMAFNGDPLGATATVSPASVTVAPGGTAAVAVRLIIDPAAAAALPAADQGYDVVTIRGRVIATPENGPALAVPFLVAPRGLSDVHGGVAVFRTQPGGETTGRLRLRNSGIRAGVADVYETLITDTVGDAAFDDLRGVGAQVFPAPPELSPVADDRLIVFAVALGDRYSNGSEIDYELLLDTNGDGQPEANVFGADSGLVTAGAANGELGSFAILGQELTGALPAVAASNGSVVLLPVLASAIGLSAGQPGFDVVYSALLNLRGNGEVMDVSTQVGHFDAYNPLVSQGDYVEIAAGGATIVDVLARARARGESRPGAG